MAGSPTTSEDSVISPEGKARSRRRRLRWLAIVVLLAILFHVPLLRGVGRVLTVDDPDGPFDAAVILGGDHRLEVVKELLDSEQVASVWLMDKRSDYLVTAGILPAESQVAAEVLTEAGITADRLMFVDSDDAIELADFAKVVASRLRQEPESRVLLICGALEGRHVRIVFDDELGDAMARQVAILGLPYDNFDVNRWWRSRSGLKEVFGRFCQLGFTLIAGTMRNRPPMTVAPDQIEQSLRRRYGRAACFAD